MTSHKRLPRLLKPQVEFDPACLTAEALVEAVEDVGFDAKVTSLVAPGQAADPGSVTFRVEGMMCGACVRWGSLSWRDRHCIVIWAAGADTWHLIWFDPEIARAGGVFASQHCLARWPPH